MKIEKELIEKHANNGNVGIQPVYEIDYADWVWYPDIRIDEPCFTVFRAEFEVSDEVSPLRFHVSADQRYELYCDGTRISKGPDRGFVYHWDFATYVCELSAGTHILEAHVWWLGDIAPEALVTYRGGFIFKADGIYDKLLTTGRETSCWKVALRSGWSFSPADFRNTYFAVGARQRLDGNKWLAELSDWKFPVIIRSAVPHSFTGISVQGWKLFPSIIPDQIDRDITLGKFRAVVNKDVPDDYIYTDDDCNNSALQQWNALLSEADNNVTIEPFQTVNLIWDLEDYYCGFCELNLSGGAGASVEWEWAESLFVAGNIRDKGNRDQVAGKCWYGFGHRVDANGKEWQHYRFYWWNAGRFCRIKIKTGSGPLTIFKPLINETRYPLENESAFECNDNSITAIRHISTRVMQMCTHESYMDCPYYEQMMYVGDARLELLTHYIMQQDNRMPRRAIEMFDLSRKEWGFTAERVTSRNLQLSPTFSLIWVWIVHDYLFWRGYPEWIADCMVGVRSSLEYFRPYLNSDGLLENLPGWPFVDWVIEWNLGYPPGAVDNVSSIVNLQYLLALQKAADIERRLGEIETAANFQARADSVAKAIIKSFWNDESGLIQDDLTGKTYSEHAQCLALLAGLFSGEREERVLSGLLNSNNLARTTIYFRYYLFEVYMKYGYIEKFFEGLYFWRELVDAGFKTTVEEPEPSRSDCHAWGAHPMIHMTTGVLGLRPLDIGMSKIIIQPQPGPLKYIKGKVPSPYGDITFDLQFDEGKCTGTLILPPEMTGIFSWNGEDISFQGRLDVGQVSEPAISASGFASLRRDKSEC